MYKQVVQMYKQVVQMYKQVVLRQMYKLFYDLVWISKWYGVNIQMGIGNVATACEL